MARLRALAARATQGLHRRSRPRRCLSSQPEPEPEARCRLSDRAKALAAGGGAAARVWEDVNALAAQPGMMNMGQGFPDFAGHAKAREAAVAAVAAGRGEQYAPINGSERLRSCVSSLYHAMYAGANGGRPLDPAQEWEERMSEQYGR